MTRPFLCDSIAGYVDGNQSMLSKICHEISCGDGGLLELIDTMGPSLVSDKETDRSKSLELLANVLDSCPHLLKRGDASIVVTFLIARLSDDPSIHNALLCAKNLFTCTTVLNNDRFLTIDFIQALFKEVTVPSLVQATRSIVYSIFGLLLEQYLQEMMSINDSFLVGFMTCVDSEKDPRNLMAVFRLFQFVVQSFDVSSFTEEMVDIPACYFPITFRAPTDDPFGITSGDLKNELKKCLIASPQFAEFAMPLFMEKLNSSSDAAIKDSLDVLTDAIPCFGVEVYIKNLDAIFKVALGSFRVGDIERETLARLLLKEIFSNLSSFRDVRETRTDEVLKICINELSDIPSQQAVAFGHLVMDIAKSCTYCSQVIIDAIIPLLLEKYALSQDLASKKAVVELFVESITVVGSVNGAEFGTFLNWKDHIWTIFTSNLTSTEVTPTLRTASQRGICEILKTGGLVTSTQLVSLVEQILEPSLKSLEGYSPESILCTITENNPRIVTSLMHQRSIDESILKSLSQVAAFQQAVLSDSQKVLAMNHYSALDGNFWTPLRYVLQEFDFLHPDLESFRNYVPLFYTNSFDCFQELFRILDINAQLEVFNLHFSDKIYSDDQILLAFMKNVRPETLRNLPAFIYWFMKNLSNADRYSIAYFSNKLQDITILDALLEAPSDAYRPEPYGALLKGLIIKAYPRAFSAIGPFFSMMTLESFKEDTLEFICRDDDMLVKKYHVVNRPLHKQRLFSIILTEISSKYTDSATSDVSLKILCSVMKYTPKQALLSNLDSIAPILLASLAAADDDALFNCLEVINFILETSAELLEGSAIVLINRLLDLGTAQDNEKKSVVNSM